MICAYMWVLIYGEYTLCICGVKVFPMVNFRPIDSDVLNVISQIVGTVQGDYHPLVQVYVRGRGSLLRWSIQSLLAGLKYTPAG
jgi:hypothetical protein